MRIIPEIDPAKLTSKSLLIVPSIDIPPRVPKVITAIALKMLVVDYKWVTEQQRTKEELDPTDFKMNYREVSSLL